MVCVCTALRTWHTLNHKCTTHTHTDVSKLRVKELKKILSSWGEECVGCTSKSDFVKLVTDKKAEHAPKTEL
jgi:uncharacterized protein with WD repeat